MEEWPDDGDSKELRLEVKAGEEVMLEHLIRFCYSKQVTITEGQLWVQLALCQQYMMLNYRHKALIGTLIRACTCCRKVSAAAYATGRPPVNDRVYGCLCCSFDT